MTDRQPLVPLCGLFERTSKSGRRYFSGLLGSARILVFENSTHNPDDPKSPTHSVFIQERVASSDHKPAVASKPPATSQTSSGSSAKQGRDFKATGSTDEQPEYIFDASGRRYRNPRFRPAPQVETDSREDLPF